MEINRCDHRCSAEVEQWWSSSLSCCGGFHPSWIAVEVRWRWWKWGKWFSRSLTLIWIAAPGVSPSLCSMSVLHSVSLCRTVVLPPSLCVWQRAETHAPLLINFVERRTIVRRWSGFHDNGLTEWDATPAFLLFFSAPPTLQRISGIEPKPDSFFSTNDSKKPRWDPFDSVELTLIIPKWINSNVLQVKSPKNVLIRYICVIRIWFQNGA